MGKKKINTKDASWKGKKPINTATKKSKGSNKTNNVQIVSNSSNPSHIKNKLKRSEVYSKYLLEKKQQKRKERLKRAKEVEALGEDVATAGQKKVPKTLDNTREQEETIVLWNDEEVLQVEDANDEFAPYFDALLLDTTNRNTQDGTTTDTATSTTTGRVPKILLTTRPRPSKELFFFIADLLQLVPQTFFYPRKTYGIKDIILYANNQGFTHVAILSEKSKVCNGLLLSHLPQGPTAFFKVSNVLPSHTLPNHGNATKHIPELNLQGFTTRLGHRIGRFLGSLFPHNQVQFQGRQIVTFHNQRDYIFVRHHRYIFEDDTTTTTTTNNKGAETNTSTSSNSKETRTVKTKKARLQELGPRFTLKLRWLQQGTFDTQFGEYEWIHKRKEMDTSRRKFHL
jgi:ribosome production factor 1